MAEIVIYPTDDNGPDERYQDGDIVCAFTDRRIGKCHADVICHHVKSGFNRDGLRPDGLAKIYHELLYTYRFERLSRLEVKRTNLISGSTDILSGSPNGKNEFIDVPLYLARATRHPRHKIFGSVGREVWYGGRERADTEQKVDALWAMIEGNTVHRRRDFSHWPLSDRELRRFLALPVMNMTESDASRAENSERNTNEDQPGFDSSTRPFITRKRRLFVLWRELGVSSIDVIDQSKRLDLREQISPFDMSNVAVKPRKTLFVNR